MHIRKVAYVSIINILNATLGKVDNTEEQMDIGTQQRLWQHILDLHRFMPQGVPALRRGRGQRSPCQLRSYV